MAKCAKFNGKLGFYSEGGAELICSADTCGSRGHAEFGCERCCPSTTATTTSFISTRGHGKQRQADLSQLVLSFFYLAAAITLLVVVLSLLFYAFKRWKSWRSHLRRAGQRDAEQGENIIEMMAVVDPIIEHPVEQGRLVVHVKEDCGMQMTPSSSVSFIPTQDEAGQKEEQKNFKYVPEGQPFLDKDSESESEGGEEAL